MPRWYPGMRDAWHRAYHPRVAAHCQGAAGAASSARMSVKPKKSKTQAPARPEPRPLTHPEVRAIVLGIMLAMFLGALDQTIVATALPTIGRHFCQSRRSVLGGHRLSAHRHRGDAALRQALRHPRPARDDADRHRHLHRRLAGLRAGAEHDRAGARARAAGARRRRADGAGADHHRRHRLARASAAATRAISARCSRPPRSAGRCSAASSPSISTGR